MTTFQTNPRGVEAESVGAEELQGNVFQTNPRGVEAEIRPAFLSWSCLFQTNPRGVEASDGPLARREWPRFRRTLVGVKRRVR